MDLDPLWTSIEGSKFVRREQLELVVQKAKLDEVYHWFCDHFVNCPDGKYLERCPFVILQGPTGCAKTSTLKWISNELRIPIKEYCETTDTTSLNYELGRPDKDEEKTNLSHSIDKRKAIKFEHFVISSIRYNTLYPTSETYLAEDASEFGSDDGFEDMVSRPQIKQPIQGIIIHVDTRIAKSQRILITTLSKLIKVIREISPKLMRRVAIVFETLEGEGDIISLSTKFKRTLKIEVFKFNPITRANMKKLVNSMIKDLKNIVIDKNTIDQLVNDCDGDIRACLNTLQLICNKSPSLHVFKQINHNSINGNELTPHKFHQANKKQKLMSDKVRNVVLNPSLMRDNTRSSGFFHVLGKIFYQKRLYPDPSANHMRKQVKRYRSIDRPYPTENSTEYLANQLDVEPANFIIWLHEHYNNFCKDSNIDKAALFLENISTADTTSINSTQSSQFYEMHNAIDQLQIHLSIESTIFSLYEDQSCAIKASHKKVSTDSGSKLLKASVDSKKELYSFNKPVSMSLSKLSEDHQSLLSHCRAKLIELNSKSIDPLKVLLDYVPYINHMSRNWAIMPPNVRAKLQPPNDSSIIRIYDDEPTMNLFRNLEKLDDVPDLDLETRHEKLMELIEEAELSDRRNML